MSRRSRPSVIASIIFLFLGLFLLVVVFLPVGVMKFLADTLVADGDFGSLTPDNVTVFRILLVAIVFSLICFAALTYFHRWYTISSFLTYLWADLRSSLRAGLLNKRDLPWCLAVLILMVMGVIYRLEFINSSLHHDEAYTYMAFAHTLRSALTDYHLPNNHVFHSILVFISTRLFGDAPWVVRLPAFTAGVLIIPAVYSLGKRHYNQVIGLGAGLLVVISPALIGYSDNARGYTLVALFGILLLIFGHQVSLSKNRFAWLLIVLVSALGMYTVPSFLFPFGILYTWLLMESMFSVKPGYASRLDFIKYWLISGVCSALLTLLFYLPILVYSGTDSLVSNPFVAPLPWSGFLETLVQRLSETWIEWTFRVPGWAVILVIAGWILSLVFHKKFPSIRFPLQVAALLWIVVLLLVQRPNAWSKVWMFLLPMVILWAAAGVFGLLGLLKIKTITLPSILLPIFLIFVGYHTASLVPQLPELWQNKGDEESAVLFVKADREAEDGLVVAPPDDAPVWYYAERHGISDALSHVELSPQWYVLVNPGEGQTTNSVMAERGPLLVNPLACVKLKTFGKLTLYKCRETP